MILFLLGLIATISLPPFSEENPNTTKLKARTIFAVKPTAFNKPTELSLVAEASLYKQFDLPYSANGVNVELPNWATDLASNLGCTCQGFDQCEQMAAELPIVGMEFGGFYYQDGFVPDKLVRIADFNFTYTLRMNETIKESAIQPLRSFVAELNALGYDVIIRSAFRSFQEQEMLYTNEPTAAMQAGYSQHQSGYAFDIHRRTDDFQVGPPIPFTHEVRRIANKHGIAHPFQWGPSSLHRA